MAYINGHEIFFGIVGTVGATVGADELNTNGHIMFGKGSVLLRGITYNETVDTQGNSVDTEIRVGDLYLYEANKGDNERGVKMRLGVGTTPPELTDYWLDDVEDGNGVDINTYVTCTAASVAGQTDGSVKYTFTFTNGGSAAVTINEVCIYDGPVMTNPVKIMLGRKVITPTTIAAGGTATFTYEIKCTGH